jgi:hypothetical protein
MTNQLNMLKEGRKLREREYENGIAAGAKWMMGFTDTFDFVRDDDDDGGYYLFAYSDEEVDEKVIEYDPKSAIDIFDGIVDLSLPLYDQQPITPKIWKIKRDLMP